MKTALTKDARGFVDGVMTFLRKEGKSSKVTIGKVEGLLGRVSARAKREKLARITSAVSLTANEQSDLAHAVGKILGHDIEVESVVDPQIIGGMIIQVGDWVVDTSLKSQLEEMANLMEQ